MSFIDRIKYFVCSLSIFLCNGLNSAAMDNNILMTPNGPYGSFFRDRPCYAPKKANFPNALDTGMKDYAVIYKYIDIPDNFRRQNECCSLCKGNFKNSQFDCHSTNIKYKCIEYRNSDVDCIFIPIPKDISIKDNNDLINLYCNNDSLKLCHNCMKIFLKPYLKNLSESFHKQCEKNRVNLTIPDAFKINVFQNNRRFSMLPKEFRFLSNERCANNIPHHTKCFCGKLAIPNSSEPVIMCCDGHLCHVNCLLEKSMNNINPKLKNITLNKNPNVCICENFVNSNELKFCADGYCLHLNCLLECLHCPSKGCKRKIKYVYPYFNTIGMMTKKEGVNLKPMFDIISNMTNH